MKSKRKAAINCTKKLRNSYKETSERSSNGVVKSVNSDNEDIFVADESADSTELSSSDNCDVDTNYRHRSEGISKLLLNFVHLQLSEPVANSPKNCFIGTAALLLRAQNYGIDNGLGLLKMNFQKNFNYFNKLSQSAYWADKILLDGTDEFDVFIYLNEGLFPNKRFLDEIKKVDKKKELLNSLSSINVLQSETDLQHELMKPLSSISVTNPVVNQHGVFINTGSYVKRMCWAPINSELYTDQFLAVSVYKELTDRSIIFESSNQSGHLIQIFNCGPLTMRTKKATPSKLEMVLTHSWGKVTDMSWSPQPLPAVCRSEKLIGHLALCCSDGFIRIIPISKQSNPGCLVTINNNHPILCLGSVRNKDNINVYPTTMHWRQEYPDRIVAGYNTGNIAVFVLEASVLMRSRIIGVDVYLKPSMFRRVFNGPVRSIQISPFNWKLISCSSLTAANAVIVDLSQPSDMILPSPIDLETTIGSKIIWPIPGDVVILAAGKHLHNKPGIQLCSAQKPAKRCRKLMLHDISSIDLSPSLNVVPIGTRSGQLRLLSMNTDYVNNLLKNRVCERKSREKQIESTFYFQYRLTQMNTHDDDNNNDKEINSQVKTEKTTVLPFCGCPVNLQCVHKLISKFSISISKNCSDELNDWQLGSMLNINEISTNPNPGSSTWISVALECGLIHVVPLTHFYRSELDEMSNGSSCCVLNAAASRLIDEILLPKSISYLPKYGRPRKYPSGTNHGKVYRRMEKTFVNKKNLTKQETSSIQEAATSSNISEFFPPNISTISLARKSTCITDYFKRNCSVELEKPIVKIPLTNLSEKSKSQRKSSVKSCKTEIKPNNVKCSTPKKSKPIKSLKILQASTPIKKSDNSSNSSMKTRLRTYQQSTLFSPVLVKKSIDLTKNAVTTKTTLPLVLPSKNQSCSIKNNNKKLLNSFSEKNSIKKTESLSKDISLPIRRRLRSHDKELNSSTGNQINTSQSIDLTNNTVPPSISITKNTLPIVLSPKNQSCSIENSNMKLARLSIDKESAKLNSSFVNTPSEDISLAIRRRLRSHDKELNSSTGNQINSSKSIDLINSTVAPSISITKTTLPIVLPPKNQSRSIENSNMKLARSSSEKETVELTSSFENISLPIRRRLRSYDKELNPSIDNRMNSSKSIDLTNSTIPPSISITKTTLPIVLLQKNQSRSCENINMKLARSSIDNESITSKSPSFENTSFEEISLPIRTRLRSYETESNSLNKSNKIISMGINNFDVSHENTANSIRNRLRSLSKETNTSTDNEKEIGKRNSLESNNNNMNLSPKIHEKQIRKRPIFYDKRNEEKKLVKKEVLTRKRSPSFESSEFNLSLYHQEVDPTWKRLRSWDKHDISSSCVTPMKKETNITKKCDMKKKFPVKKMCKYFETNESVRVESIINQSSSLSINESIFSNDEKLSMSPVIIVEYLSQTEIKSFDKTVTKVGKSNEVKVNNSEQSGKLSKENVTNNVSKQVRKKSGKFNEKSLSENQIINVVGKESKSIKSKKSKISSKRVEKIENLEKETVVKEKRKSRKVDESSVKGENIKSIKRKRKLSNSSKVQESKKPKLDEIISFVSNAQYNTNNNAVASITNSPSNEKSSIKKIDIQKSNMQTVPLRRFFNTDIDEEEDYIETSRVIGSVYNTISCQDVAESQIDISRSETNLKIHNNSVPSNLYELQPISHSTPSSRNIETEEKGEDKEEEEEEEEEEKSPVKKKSKKSKEIFKESKSQKKETKKSKNNLINEEKLKKLQNIFSNKRKELLDSQLIIKETVVQCPALVSIELQPASNAKTSCWWGQQNNDQVELDVNKIDDLSLKSNFVSPKKKTNINASMDDRMDKIKQVISRGISQCDLDENVVDNYSPELLQPFRPLKTPKSLNSSLSFNS